MSLMTHSNKTVYFLNTEHFHDISLNNKIQQRYLKEMKVLLSSYIWIFVCVYFFPADFQINLKTLFCLTPDKSFDIQERSLNFLHPLCVSCVANTQQVSWIKHSWQSVSNWIRKEESGATSHPSLSKSTQVGGKMGAFQEETGWETLSLSATLTHRETGWMLSNSPACSAKCLLKCVYVWSVNSNPVKTEPQIRTG